MDDLSLSPIENFGEILTNAEEMEGLGRIDDKKSRQEKSVQDPKNAYLQDSEQEDVKKQSEHQEMKNKDDSDDCLKEQFFMETPDERVSMISLLYT